MRSVLIILFLLPAMQAQLQPAGDSENDLLPWNEFYELQWYDFQGEPDENRMGDAGAAVHIKAKPFLVKKKIKYDVTAFFNRSKSWARDHSPSLLAHEQLHFDIAELYARKIRKKIKEMNDEGVNDIKVYNAAIHELLLESNAADERYDMQTLHGAMSGKQAQWAEEVKSDLEKLKHFKKTRWVIKR